MHMTVTATVQTLDDVAYMKAVRAAVREVFIAAGRRFLMTAVPRIPVWTGMARGAFRNAEDVFGRVSSSGPKRPVRIRSDRGGSTKDVPTRKGYYYYPPNGGRIERTPEKGRDFSTRPSQIIQLEGATLVNGRSAMRIKYEINISYFTKLDETKWHAFKDASEEIVRYVQANLRLPDMADFIVRRYIKTG